jgi:outer membrane murein-binding lipoprotein Lpp
MSAPISFTPEVVLAILVPFGGALFAIGVLHNKLGTLKDDVKTLKEEVKALSIRFEVHKLSVEAWQESAKRGDNK